MRIYTNIKHSIASKCIYRRTGIAKFKSNQENASPLIMIEILCAIVFLPNRMTFYNHLKFLNHTFSYMHSKYNLHIFLSRYSIFQHVVKYSPMNRIQHCNALKTIIFPFKITRNISPQIASTKQFQYSKNELEKYFFFLSISRVYNIYPVV